MTYKDLKEYRKLRDEVERLAQRIEELENSPGRIVTDSVRGSSRHEPFQERVVVITGLDQRGRIKCDMLKKILAERMERLEYNLLEVEQFISRVSDAEMRLIIDLYIRQGLSWNATAVQVYGHPCGDNARMALKRYIKKSM